MPSQHYTASLSHNLSNSPYSLSHSLDQLRQACVLDPAMSGNAGMQQQQQNQPQEQSQQQQQQGEKLAKQLQLTIRSPTVLLQSKAEPGATQRASGTDAALPKLDADAAEYLQGQSEGRNHAKEADEVASPTRVSSLSQDRSAQQTSEAVGLDTDPSGDQDPQAEAAAAADMAARSGKPARNDVHADTALPAGSALATAQQSSEPTADAGQGAAQLQPAASDTAATRDPLSEAPSSPLPRAQFTPPGACSTHNLDTTLLWVMQLICSFV